MTVALYGAGVSRGIAIGKIYVLQRGVLNIKEYSIPPDRVDDEILRFKSALLIAKLQLKEIRNNIPDSTPVDVAAFIDTHLLIMSDTALAQTPITTIQTCYCNAEWALKLYRDTVVAVFEGMDDPYLRARKDDVDQVIYRILRILLNEPSHYGPSSETNPLAGLIVCADDLSPADTVLMQHQGVAAFVTEYGGPTSHTTILARSLGIPAIVGVSNARHFLQAGETAVVDGQLGVIVVDPSSAITEYFQSRQFAERKHLAELAKIREKPATSLDGQAINLYANLELPEDLLALKRVGVKGVGLYRTELLFLNRSDLPDEEEQLAAYERIIEAMEEGPVTIRTLDIGADKQLSNSFEIAVSKNPALGLRAIRLCLQDQVLFRTQLRAILRASIRGQVRLMIPMLSNLQELFQVLQLLEECKKELRQQGLRFNPSMPVGGMIEVPAAALVADSFARHLDFLSIGTNDLIQYAIAIDRTDDAVNYLYDPLHPGVLRLIKTTIEAGRRTGVPVAMCGEMAGDLRFTRLLLAMGLREFSMHPALVLEVKRAVRATHIGNLVRSVDEALLHANPEEISALIREINDDIESDAQESAVSS